MLQSPETPKSLLDTTDADGRHTSGQGKARQQLNASDGDSHPVADLPDDVYASADTGGGTWRKKLEEKKQSEQAELDRKNAEIVERKEAEIASNEKIGAAIADVVHREMQREQIKKNLIINGDVLRVHNGRYHTFPAGEAELQTEDGKRMDAKIAMIRREPEPDPWSRPEDKRDGDRTVSSQWWGQHTFSTRLRPGFTEIVRNEHQRKASALERSPDEDLENPYASNSRFIAFQPPHDNQDLVRHLDDMAADRIYAMTKTAAADDSSKSFNQPQDAGGYPHWQQDDPDAGSPDSHAYDHSYPHGETHYEGYADARKGISDSSSKGEEHTMTDAEKLEQALSKFNHPDEPAPPERIVVSGANPDGEDGSPVAESHAIFLELRGHAEKKVKVSE